MGTKVEYKTSVKLPGIFLFFSKITEKSLRLRFIFTLTGRLKYLQGVRIGRSNSIEDEAAMPMVLTSGNTPAMERHAGARVSLLYGHRWAASQHIPLAIRPQR